MRQAIATLSEERPETPGPWEQPSVLAVPWYSIGERTLRLCHECPLRMPCIRSVCRLGPFALPECEAALDEKPLGTPKGKVGPLVQNCIATTPGLLVKQIAKATGCSTAQVTRTCTELLENGLALVDTQHRYYPPSYAGQIKPRHSKQPDADEVREARAMYASGVGITQIAEHFERSFHTIKRIVTGERHKDVS